MTNHGRDKSNYRINEWLDTINKLGVGEVMITSIDNDGLCNGLTKNWYKKFKSISLIFQ